jgi:hypothetical protein
MSRGHGQAQRAILEAVERDGEVFAVRVIAKHWAMQQGVPYTPTVAASFRRAAGRLVEEGALRAWDLVLPTFLDASGRARGQRLVFCIGPPALEVDAKAAAAAASGYLLIGASDFDTKEG